MAYGHLPTTTVVIPFIGGLNTKGDKRAKNPPMLDVCLNVEFDDVGGLRTRYPYGAVESSLFGGGLIADARKVVANGDERLLFTKDSLYSWSTQQSAWVRRGTHLAVKVAEQSRFVTPGEQTDCDRAELAGTIVYAWVESSTVFVAAADRATGSVLVGPTAIAGVIGDGSARPRLVALATKILLFYLDDTISPDLMVKALDPADVASGLAAAPTGVLSLASGMNAFFDVTRVIGADQAVLAMRRNPTASYEVATVTAGLVVAQATKARVCDGAIAVSCAPTGTHIQVVRANGNNIQGDLIALAGFVDVYTGQAIGTVDVTLGTGVNQIAAAHRSVQDGGAYRCYVFWSAEHTASGATAWKSKVNWVDTANVLGAQATFVRRIDMASRAFDHEGRVYVWGSFALGVGSGGATAGQQLESRFFLYRDDAFLVAKGVSTLGGGFQPSTGRLPGVDALGGGVFAWCATEKRTFLFGESFGGRSPRDVVIRFDSNEARRCARLGETLYITGGEILQYDGRQLVEVGFHLYPYYFTITNSAAGGAIEAGTYSYKMSFSWLNARGESDRSTAIDVQEVTFAGAPPHRAAFSDINPLYVTHKTGASNVGAASVEVWRTAKDPPVDAPFYMVTASDPTTIANPNRYLSNDTTVDFIATLNDELDDASLTSHPSFPENGDVLESLAPPAASIIAATETRVFLAGVAGDPDRVWYSKQRSAGEVAAFHESLTLQIPAAGGDLTAIAFLNDTLVVFRERAIYLLPGDGFDNTLGGSNYGPARTASTEFGAVNHESVALTPDGLLFKSHKGWCVLTRGWAVDDKVGLPVAAYDSETPLAVHVMQAQRQVRVLTSSRMLVYDWLVNQWGEWTIAGALDATVWDGVHYYLTGSGPRGQLSTYAGVDYGYDVESAWIKINELQGRGIVRAFELLGEVRSAHSIRVRLARNYQSDGVGGWNYFQDKTWPITPTTVGGPLQLKFGPSIKRPIQAIKVRLTAVAAGGGSPTTETAKLTALSFDLAVEEGLYSGLPAAQKQ